MYAWEGLGADVDLTPYSEARMPSEEKWYALTGRIVEAKVEADGDIHIVLEDTTGNKSERLAPRFRLAQSGARFGKQYSVGQRQKFPFSVKSAHALKIRECEVGGPA